MKNYLTFSLLAILFTTFSSCHSDDDGKIYDLKIDTTTFILLKGESKEVPIIEGNGNYTVTSSDINIAQATLKDNSVFVEAKKAGNASITVEDVKGKTAIIKVTVNDLMLSVTEVTVIKGNTSEVKVTGSKSFTTKASVDGIVTLSSKDGIITVTGVAAGQVEVTVKDIDTQQEAKFMVTVGVELSLDKYEINIARKSKEIIVVESFKGKPEADQQYYNLEIVEGTDIIAVQKAYYDGIEHHFEIISTGKLGTATVKVTHTLTNQEKQVVVTILPVDLNIQLFPAEVTMIEGETKVIGINGNGEYEVSYSMNGIVTATATEDPEDDNGFLKVNALKAGETTVTILDNITKQTKDLKVTVNAEQKDFTVDENGVLIEVRPSALVPNLVIPIYVKEIPDEYPPFFKGNSTITKVKMEGVRKLGKFTFGNMNNLQEVVIGEHISVLDKYVFANTPNLISVTIKATTPPTLGNLVFNGTKDTKTLYVPASSLSEYQTNEWTQYFGKIVAIQ
ncbi:MAG: leucine-rich repeat protein [Weeksellaceae bacterium]